MEPARILEFDFDQVRPDEAQPRKFFDPEDLEAMAETFRERGQIKPAHVRRDKGGGPTPFVIVDGERRWRVARRLHEAEPNNPRFAKYRAYVEDLEGEDLLVVQFLANSGKGHTPTEKVEVLQRLLDAGVQRNKARQRLGIPPKQYRHLKEFLDSPKWLRPYGAPMTISVPVTAEDGSLVLDDTGRPTMTQTVVQPLPLTHLAVLAVYAKKLVDWDQAQQATHPEGEHRNVAQSTLCRVADKAIRQSMPVAKLTKLCIAATNAVMRGPVSEKQRPTPSPFTRGADGALRIATTDPEELSEQALEQLVAELESVLLRLRAAKDNGRVVAPAPQQLAQ